MCQALRLNGHKLSRRPAHRGPTKCSGLNVARYAANALRGEFGGGFQTIDSCTEYHMTLWGTEQEFVYCYYRIHL